MSAPPFFHWESLSKSEQEQWSKKMGESKDRVVWCRSRKQDEEQRPFEADRKKIFSNRSKQTTAKAGKWIRKGAKGSQCAGKCGGDRATSNAQ